VFTWLYEITGNLLAPIIAHALFNGLNFVGLLLDLPGWIERTMNP
jgi:membrane protease YdiL (CAAX protease family)